MYGYGAVGGVGGQSVAVGGGRWAIKELSMVDEIGDRGEQDWQKGISEEVCCRGRVTEQT